jgi:hypothetical protein
VKRKGPSQLPAEHGSWAFLLLPTVSALALRPSAAGAWLLLWALAAFLARVPLKRWIKAGRLLRGDRFVLAAEALVAAGAFALAVRGLSLHALVLLATSLLPGAVAVILDFRGRGRTPGVEMLSILSPCLLGGAMVAAGGGAPPLAWTLAAGAFASLAAPVFYLRNLLDRAGARPDASPVPALLVHAAACALAVGLKLLCGMNWLWPLWMGALALRAAAEPHLFALPGARRLGLREALVCGVSAGALVFSMWRADC